MSNTKQSGSPTKRSRSLRWTVEDAAAELSEWRKSGEPLEAFAAGRGLKVERLRRWQRQLAKGAESPSENVAFKEVPSADGRWAVGSAVSIRWLPGAELRLEVHDPSAVAPGWLGELARALSGSVGR